ncbi:hypothetical protein [Mesobacillus jeotgali]|uniref:hypothetical protein n=1 Tax=Mesobacillus jeotgali TaxID=129985 RepID=UPI000C856E8B|nr:hypothetical protein [Mesobacillus jeotgali]
MHKKKQQHLVLVIFLAVLLVIGFLGGRFLLSSPSSQAKAVVDQFYSYEQDANFSGSWKLLHPYMKEKFHKAAYIQDRSHVFIGHFGAETFSYEISEAEELKGWKAAKGEKPFDTAFRFEVTQRYTGKYGRFSFLQEVYVVEYKEDWVILWDFNH